MKVVCNEKVHGLEMLKWKNGEILAFLDEAEDGWRGGVETCFIKQEEKALNEADCYFTNEAGDKLDFLKMSLKVNFRETLDFLLIISIVK